MSIEQAGTRYHPLEHPIDQPWRAVQLEIDFTASTSEQPANVDAPTLPEARPVFNPDRPLNQPWLQPLNTRGMAHRSVRPAERTTGRSSDGGHETQTVATPEVAASEDPTHPATIPLPQPLTIGAHIGITTVYQKVYRNGHRHWYGIDDSGRRHHVSRKQVFAMLPAELLSGGSKQVTEPVSPVEPMPIPLVEPNAEVPTPAPTSVAVEVTRHHIWREVISHHRRRLAAGITAAAILLGGAYYVNNNNNGADSHTTNASRTTLNHGKSQKPSAQASSAAVPSAAPSPTNVKIPGQSAHVTPVKEGYVGRHRSVAPSVTVAAGSSIWATLESMKMDGKIMPRSKLWAASKMEMRLNHISNAREVPSGFRLKLAATKLAQLFSRQRS